jgi:hypothetical protein
MNMAAPIEIALIAGIASLVVSATGGGIKVKDTNIPRLPAFSRIALAVLGTLLCVPWVVSMIPKKEVAGPPVGTVVAYAGDASSMSRDWLLCDGRALSKSEFAELFNNLNTQYGTGIDPKTNQRTGDFNLPKLQGRFVRSRDEQAKLGQTGGSDEIPELDIPSHRHGLPTYTGFVAKNPTGPGNQGYNVKDDHQGYGNSVHLTVEGGPSVQEGQHSHELGGKTEGPDNPLKTPKTSFRPSYIDLDFYIKAR